MNIGAGIGVGFSNPRGEPAFEYQESQACQNGSDITPVINNPGGTFSSSPAGLSLNSTTGVIDVSASTVGTYTVTYSIGPTEDTITILPADDASFSYSSTSFRQNASNPAPTITGLVGGVFSGPTGIIFADSGTNTNSSSGIINLAASTVGGPYTITYTTTGNCPASRNFDLSIQVALSITYSATSFCEDGGNTAAPTVVGDPGSGTFASTTGLTINSTTGVINTDTSTPDENTPYTVTYTASTGETATTQVTIKNLDNATFSYSATSFCENASNQTPTIATPGGTFTTQDITFRPFQMQFDVSGGKTISLNSVYGSSFYIDWGDGNTETNTGGTNRTITHTYASGLTNKTISIGSSSDSGPLEKLRFTNSGSDLLDIPQWGSTQFTSLNNMFTNCNNTSFQISASDTPNILSGAKMDETFYNADYFNTDISNWDVSNVTGGLLRVFGGADSFNQNLSSWDIQSSNLYLFFWATSMSTENYTDTIVGWAVTVYKNSGKYNVSMGAQYSRVFDNSRTSDNASGQTYAAKYGSDWTATGWTDAGDARDYLTGATANWTISGDSRIN